MWQPTPEPDAVGPWLGFGRRESYPDPASVYAACAAANRCVRETKRRGARRSGRRNRIVENHVHEPPHGVETGLVNDSQMSPGPLTPQTARLQFRRFRAFTLPIGGGPLEPASDDEVFVMSPRSAIRKQHLSCRRQRSTSLPCYLHSQHPVLHPAELLHGKDTWYVGVRRRASEQTMLAQLKSLAKKQGLRNAGRRQQANATGADFSALYGRTIEALENCLVLQPPRRRHSSIDAYAPFIASSTEELQSPRKRRRSIPDDFQNVHEQLL